MSENTQLSRFVDKLTRMIHEAHNTPMDDRMTSAEVVGALVISAVQVVLHENDLLEEESSP